MKGMYKSELNSFKDFIYTLTIKQFMCQNSISTDIVLIEKLKNLIFSVVHQFTIKQWKIAYYSIQEFNTKKPEQRMG